MILSRGGGGLQELLTAREQELRELFGALEQRLGERELQCRSLEDQLKALQDDFVYNLSLLADRDKELESYDVLTDGLNTDVHDREGRISELKSMIAERNTELANFKALLCTQEQQHHEAMRRMQKDAEAELRRLEDAATARAEELELARADMRLQIKAAHQEVELQRVAFQAELDSVKRGQEAAIRAGRQEVAHQLLITEHQASCAVAELEAVKASRNSLEVKLAEQVEANRLLDKKLYQLEWEVMDAGKATTHRIAELEKRLAKSQQSAAKAQAAFHRSRERVLLEAEESKRILEHRSTMAENQIEPLKKQHSLAIAQIDAERAEASREAHLLQETVSAKDAEIHQLRTLLDADKSDVTSLQRKHQNELAARDDSLNRHKRHIADLEGEIRFQCNNVQTLQENLGRLAAHQEELQRIIAQQDLDSERKEATLLRQHSGLETDLVRSLVAAKESAEAEVKLLRGKLNTEPNGRSQGHAWRPLASPPYEGRPTGTDGIAGHEEDGKADLHAENIRLTSIIQQMKTDMQAMHDAMQIAAASQQKPGKWESDCWGEEETRAATHSVDQMQSLRNLLLQKQNIIDDLLAQQSTVHQKVDVTHRNRTGYVQDQRQVDPGYTSPFADQNAQSQRENIALRKKLVEATEDLQRMAHDRSRLLDMSNSLKAEVRYWTDKREARAEVGTQTLSTFKSTMRYKALVNVQPPSAIPRAIGTPHPVTQSARATKSQKQAQERMVGRRGAGFGGVRGVATSDEGEETKGRRLRARRIRNWNERSDESE
ncbi:Coiled-coil domain-containing protein 57 [Geranomyces variabilis]|uniref:Coiled-coil domain-containing protein 57 n=1 Tax=Geranomyces variabilis TaxID=109894 RepID=A0AAD5TN96_9FUNG|nr:Coiled-coil domain-containing protein 57 [Geranomyces variabilis]